MKPRILIPMLVCLWAAPSWSASIGLFSSEDCTSCTLQIPPGQGAGTIYIRADSHGQPAFNAAYFKVTGLPKGWTAVSTPSPEASNASGDPFGEGAAIGFPSIQSGSCVLLYTVTLTPPASGDQATLRVSHPDHPPLGGELCPGPLTDSPLPACFACPACVSGGNLFVNSATDCSVAVQQNTWSLAKQIYR